MYYITVASLIAVVVLWLVWIGANIIAVANNKEMFNLWPLFEKIPVINEPLLFILVAVILIVILLMLSLMWFITLPVTIAVVILVHVKKRAKTTIDSHNS